VKDKADQILESEQARYLEGLLPCRDAVLAEIEQAAATARGRTETSRQGSTGTS
jgi:hypothetical protein